MLTPEQIGLIRSSAQVMADSDVSATNLFYARLFEAEPTVRNLFPQDMFRQSDKLWASIVAVVKGVDNLESLGPTLRVMGRRHVGYGAQPAHYDVVRAILIDTIASFLKQDWTDAHAKAWDIALAFVCETMLAGAHDAAA